VQANVFGFMFRATLFKKTASKASKSLTLLSFQDSNRNVVFRRRENRSIQAPAWQVGMETTVLHEVHQHNNSKRTTDRLSIHTSPRATSWQVDDVD